MIEISGLHKSYRKNHVLKGVDLKIGKGKITAVLGPNGSGKTTLIKCLLGMVIPQEGDILVEGTSILNKWDYRSALGYLPQIAKFPENLKVKELIKMIKDIRGQQGDESVLMKTFELEKFLHQPLKTLSGGSRQKLNIMLALMFDSPYIILDEPTSGLDPVAVIRFRELILQERNKGKAILLTTHILNLVEEIADEIIFILEGKIFFNGSIIDLKEMQGGNTLEQTIALILEKNNA